MRVGGSVRENEEEGGGGGEEEVPDLEPPNPANWRFSTS